MKPNEQFLDVQGIRTHILSAGESGSQVVLLHGGGLDSATLSWGAFLPDLAQQHRVIAFDWPGYGESDRPERAYSIEFYLDFLEHLLDTLGIERTSLVGISLGGSLAMGFTLRHPPRVERLVLVDSYGLQREIPYGIFGYWLIKATWLNRFTYRLLGSRSAAKWSLGAILKRPGSITDELVDKIYQELHRPRVGEAWMSLQQSEVQRSGTRTVYLDQVGQIRVPTLILHGTKDTLVPHAGVRLAHERIAGSQLHWMEGCGHWPQRDHPQEFSRVVTEFLAD